MITGVTGDPRAGKSNHVMLHYVVKALQEGTHVYCSIEGVNPFIISEVYGTKERPIDTSKFHAITQDCWNPWELDPEIDERRMYVMDEIQKVYPTSTFREHPDRRKKLVDYLTTHGHKGDAVVWITPNPDLIDTNIRKICEHWLYIRKLNFLPVIFGGSSDRYVVLQSKGYTTKGPWIGKDSYSYDPRIQVCYRSRDVGREEIKTESDKTRKSSWPFLMPFILIALLLAYGAYSWYKSKHVRPMSTTIQTTTSGTQQNAANEINADGWMVAEDSASTTWYYGALPVAQTPGVPAFFGGVIRGGNAAVRIISRQIPRSRPSGEETDVGSEDKGASK